MARSARQRRPASDVNGVPALALTPIINLVLLLTAALLLASSWVATSAVVVVAPRFVGAGPAATSASPGGDFPGSSPFGDFPGSPASQPAPLNLTIVITDQGFYLATSGRVLSAQLTDTAVARGPTVPRRADGSYDFIELSAKLALVKDAFPEENRVVISAEPEIGYGVLVQTMEAARHSRERGELFADVVLSAGVG
jgi:biopolymer transport protein ExbD